MLDLEYVQLNVPKVLALFNKVSVARVALCTSFNSMLPRADGLNSSSQSDDERGTQGLLLSRLTVRYNLFCYTLLASIPYSPLYPAMYSIPRYVDRKRMRTILITTFDDTNHIMYPVTRSFVPICRS